MSESFQGKITGPLKVILETAEQDTKFNTAIGDDFDKMTYPCISVIPDNSTYQNDLEYAHSFITLFVFEKESDHINLIQAMEDVEEAIDLIVEDLETDSDVKEYKPTEFNYLVAENSGTRLNVIEVSWTVTNMIDFAA